MAYIGVVGAGYVGLTTAACLSSLGHDVVCADVDPARVAALCEGEVPIHEEGLGELVRSGLDSGRLHFVLGARSALAGRSVVFLCVATPSLPNGSADLSQVEAVVREIGPSLEPGAIVVSKSTVPIGSTPHLQALLGRADVAVVNNPEFLREGSAVRDFLHPDRIVLGSDDPAAADTVGALFDGIDAPVVTTDPISAQTIKYASNAMLAVRVTFVNAIAALCDATGAQIDDVLRGIGLDRRIGPAYLQPGPGWGGSCLPKDTRALLHTAEHYGVNFELLAAAVEQNSAHASDVVNKVRRALGGSLHGSLVAVWGLAFKAGTDDLRDSPAVAIAQALAAGGATVRAFDPSMHPHSVGSDLAGVEISHSLDAAVKEADCLVVLTEWAEFAESDPHAVGPAMSQRTVVDARNHLDAARWRSAGFRYLGLGRR